MGEGKREKIVDERELERERNIEKSWKKKIMWRENSEICTLPHIAFDGTTVRYTTKYCVTLHTRLQRSTPHNTTQHNTSQHNRTHYEAMKDEMLLLHT